MPLKRALTLVELLIVIAIIGLLIAFLLPNVRSAREPARRNVCGNNVKQIALALQRYEEVHGAFPPAHTTDAEGKPLHSWRTLILPYMEELPLYESIDLTKPWDDPVNADAFKKNVSCYECPSSPWERGLTTYLAVTTPNSFLRASQPRNLSDITDDKSKTVMVIEVDEEHAVPWMSPVDADESVVLGLGGPESKLAHPNGMQAAFVDGSVQFLYADTSPAVRRAFISMAGNDKVTAEDAD